MSVRTRRKCCLINPREVNAFMCKLAPAESLPQEYGGAGPAWPGPADAETFEDQVGAVAAASYRRAGVVPQGAKPFRELAASGSRSPALAAPGEPALSPSPAGGASRSAEAAPNATCWACFAAFGGIAARRGR